MAGAWPMVLALCLPAPSWAATRELRVRANPAFAACLAPAIDTFNRSSAVRAVIDPAEPDPNADLVVGDDLEMTRLLEGGTAELASAFDLGYLPWVIVAPQGSPAGEVLAHTPEPVSVLAGKAGREARASLAHLGRARLRLTRDATELRRARYALVPRSLAGSGEHRGAAVRPLVATAAVIPGSPHAAAARRLLAFLRSEEGARSLGRCFDPAPSAGGSAQASGSVGASDFVQAVVDWWLPQCSLDRNRYNDPREVVGAPDAASLGGRDNFRGFMSLGQGGFVTVDMGATAVDGPGADIRVFQTATGEPVTVYASMAAGGPFVLVGLRVACGVRSSGIFSNHCDFDLRDAGLGQARYFKIEDGEIYPCLAGGTLTEGADLDAVQILNGR